MIDRIKVIPEDNIEYDVIRYITKSPSNRIELWLQNGYNVVQKVYTINDIEIIELE